MTKNVFKKISGTVMDVESIIFRFTLYLFEEKIPFVINNKYIKEKSLLISNCIF